jgi:hypothetical protein
MREGKKIRRNIKMKSICFSFCFIIFGCGSIKNSKSANEDVMYVVFNDFFRNEQVDLTICDCNIFKKAIVNSNEIGVTRIHVKSIYKKGFIFVYNKKSTKCKSCDKENVKMEINISNKAQTFYVNLKNGKYIGLDKSKNGVEILQRTKPFEYD